MFLPQPHTENHRPIFDITDDLEGSFNFIALVLSHKFNCAVTLTIKKANYQHTIIGELA